MRLIVEIIEVITPLSLGIIGCVIAITAIINSPKLSSDRFALISSLALGAIASAGGASQAGTKIQSTMERKLSLSASNTNNENREN